MAKNMVVGRRAFPVKEFWPVCQVRMPPAFHEALEEMAKKTGVTKSDVVRHAVRQWLMHRKEH